MACRRARRPRWIRRMTQTCRPNATAMAAVNTSAPKAASAAVKTSASEAAPKMVQTPATKATPASVALSPVPTGAGAGAAADSLPLTASGLPIPPFDREAPALESVIAMATATPEPRNPVGSFTAFDVAHSSGAVRPAAPPLGRK